MLRASAASTRAWIAPIQAAKSASVALASIGCARRRVGGQAPEGLEDLAFEHPHLLLRGFQAIAALLGEFEAPLVRRERLPERQAAVFHSRNDALEFRQGLLEAGLRGALRLLGHAPAFALLIGGCHHNRGRLAGQTPDDVKSRAFKHLP